MYCDELNCDDWISRLDRFWEDTAKERSMPLTGVPIMVHKKKQFMMNEVM